MENREIDLEHWVEKRLETLRAPAGWEPDSARAFGELRKLDGTKKRRRLRRLVLAGAFGVVCVAALLLEAPKAYCAGPGCASQPANPKSAPASKPHSAPSFKQAGRTNAPITLEIYSDYECPACANAFRNLIPLLLLNYVQTGKVRLLHRDFPLPMHPYARLAARYANAAGLAGEYDVAAAQLFRTQSTWAANGEIDAQLMQVLPPGDMQKIRQLVSSDATLDDTVNADIVMGREDQIASTPTIVVVKNGRREKLPPGPSYELLKSYLDGLLK
jgi:protein-disulfide isomerase